MRKRLPKDTIRSAAALQAMRYRQVVPFSPTVITPPFQRDSKERPIVYPEFGRCVYCGSTDTLSTEHIVPRGLGGNILFLRASCEKCRKITQQFETVCMRKNFLYFRVHTGLHQHPKERPGHFPLRIGRSDAPPVPVLRSAHPNWLVLPLFLRPGILVEAPLGMPYITRGFQVTNPRDLQVIQQQYRGPFFVDYNFDLNAFAKMLAKIAHCLAFAVFHKSGKVPDDVFKPYLPSFIRGMDDNLGPHLVGQIQYIGVPEVDNDLYKYAIATISHGRKRLLIATIRLFANWRGPVYTVVVGERLRESSE
jgi:HNH endonuclease